MSDLARLTSSRREALERFDASMSQVAPSAAGTVSEPLHHYRGAEAKKSAPRVSPTRTLTAVVDDTEGSPLNQDEDAKGLFTKTAHFSGKVRSSRSASTLREYDPKIFDEGQEQWVARTLKDREEQYMGKTPLNMVVTTWNVGAIKPNFGDIHEWLTDDLLKDADVVVVGLQEVCELKGTDGITTDESIGTAWARKIVEHLNSYGFKRYATPDASPGFKPRMYELVASQQLVGVLLLVFKFTELPAKVTSVHVDKVGVGIMGVLGNKGGAAIRLVVAETSVCFMCTHLSAHHDSSARRNQDFHEILRRMVFNGELEAGESASPVLECDFVFWMGDLNYRVDTTSEPFPRTQIGWRLPRFCMDATAAALLGAANARTRALPHGLPERLPHGRLHLVNALKARRAGTSAHSSSSRTATSPRCWRWTSWEKPCAGAAPSWASSRPTSASRPRATLANPRTTCRIAPPWGAWCRCSFAEWRSDSRASVCLSVFLSVSFCCSHTHCCSLCCRYKYEPLSDLYEQRPGEKKRIPGWCDRILWHCRREKARDDVQVAPRPALLMLVAMCARVSTLLRAIARSPPPAPRARGAASECMKPAYASATPSACRCIATARTRSAVRTTSP